jgi:hypothetical protein
MAETTTQKGPVKTEAQKPEAAKTKKPRKTFRAVIHDPEKPKG